jgi:hypothetical protein
MHVMEQQESERAAEGTEPPRPVKTAERAARRPPR